MCSQKSSHWQEDKRRVKDKMNTRLTSIVEQNDENQYFDLIKADAILYKEYLTFWELFTNKFGIKKDIENIYCFYHQIDPRMCICGNPVQFKNFKNGYMISCSRACKSANHSMNMKKFWGDKTARREQMASQWKENNPIHNPDSRERMQNTCQELFGAPTPMESSAVQKKIQEKHIKNLGVPFPFQNDQVRLKGKNTFRQRYGDDIDLMFFARKGFLDLHNGNNPFATPDVKSKIYQYWNDNYGVSHHFKVPHILEKFKNTIKTRYNRENISQIGIPQVAYNILTDKELLSENLLNKGLIKLSSELGISRSLVISYHNRFDLDIIKTKSRSVYEDDILKSLGELGLKFRKNDRKIIKPLELDFVSDDYKLAIEFNGLYYHSEFSGEKDSKYHAQKTQLAGEKGYQLIHIFEDEWLEKSEIIKRHIKHLCNKTENVIGARKVRIEEIDKETAKFFLEQYHIQGKTEKISNAFGAYFNNSLIGVITFVKKENNVYDLTRFSTDCLNSYPGLLSKFLKHFSKKQQHAKEIETFADLRWSIGAAYLRCGFEVVGYVAPDYQYTDYQTREHKFNYRKNKIKSKFDIDITGKTEIELMTELGFDRIWDCGKIKFKLKF
jgi:very-short-patch-repair endonuclease